MARRRQLRLLSSLPGRQRWEIRPLRGNRQRALSVETSLARRVEVRTVEANPLTGRILIRSDPTLSTAKMRRWLEQALSAPLLDADSCRKLALRREELGGHPSAYLAKVEHGSAFIVLTIGGRWILRSSLLPAAATPGFALLIGGIASFGIVITGFSYLRAAARTLLGKSNITTGTLVGTAVLASVALGEQLTALVVVWLLNIGEYLEELTLQRARNRIRALLEEDENEAVWAKVGNVELRLNLSELKLNDLVVVFAGHRIPVDGRIEAGHGTVNEAAITGESMPRVRTIGDYVFAGTLLMAGRLEIRVGKLGNDTVVGKLIRRVEQAQELRPRIQTVGQVFSRRVVPASFFLSGLVFVLTGDPTRALTILLVVCPCAAGLSTPTAVRAGIGNSASRGILVKGGRHLETLAQVDTILFDKTGTLTEGSPRVERIVPLAADIEADQILQLAACAELHCQHPLALSVLARAEARQLSIPAQSDWQSLDGLGVRASIESQGWLNGRILVGRARLMTDHGLVVPPPAHELALDSSKRGETAIFVGFRDRVVGLITVRDAVRPGAREVLSDLRKAGIDNLLMLTGDHGGVARPVAEQVGIDHWFSELMPEQKYQVIRKLQDRGYRVAMVGDGVNDAPALAVADVGIAMGTAGSDVAIETADIALASDRLDGLVSAVHLSRATLRTIRSNYGIALGVNGFGLVLAALGRLQPIAAAVLHNLSTVLVVSNSGRLIRFDPAPLRPDDSR